jgi:hypothetical protein
LVFDVATFRGLPDEDVTCKPARWLLAQYERIEKARYDAHIDTALAVQLGTGRALAQALGAKSLGDLPAFEDARAGGALQEKAVAFHRKFEAANAGRCVQSVK